MELAAECAAHLPAKSRAALVKGCLAPIEQADYQMERAALQAQLEALEAQAAVAQPADRRDLEIQRQETETYLLALEDQRWEVSPADAAALPLIRVCPAGVTLETYTRQPSLSKPFQDYLKNELDAQELIKALERVQRMMNQE